MWINYLSDLPPLIRNTHFAILVLPKGYGNSEISTALKSKNCFVLQPEVEKSAISIEQVRELRQLCRSKQLNQLTIIIEAADKMSENAANAFLKLLEEPNANISFVFITDDFTRILVTIRSRAQVYNIRPLNSELSAQLLHKLDPKIDTAKQQQILFLASGLPGEIKKLATNKKYFASATEKVQSAKVLVQGTSQEKAQWLYGFKPEKLAKDTRAKLIEILDLAARFYRISFDKTHDPTSVHKISNLETARSQILQNANYKLALLANVI